MDDTVLKLLDELEQAVDEGRSSPFSNKVQVDKDEIFEIIDEIKMKLPKETKFLLMPRRKLTKCSRRRKSVLASLLKSTP